MTLLLPTVVCCAVGTPIARMFLRLSTDHAPEPNRNVSMRMGSRRLLGQQASDWFGGVQTVDT